MTFQVGSEIARYRIVGTLGQGGMGVVYEAVHALLGRKAALKTLLAELSGNQDFKERFIRESQVVAAIDHPNIIPIYDAGDADGTAYIAMRYVPGVDLAGLIQRSGAIPPGEALSILEQAGAALDAAHARGLVHRDIKPANILIEEGTNRIYLTDFGIVKEEGRAGATQAGFFLGTIDYAAPEQLEGKELSSAADLYAFGCVLFECLTGRRPFDGASDMAIARAHVLDPPPLVTSLRPDLPEAVDAVVERALAKEPEERFESCRAFVEAVRLALAGADGAAARQAADPVAAAPIAARPARRATTLTNVPPQTSPIVGRDEELAELVSILQDESCRLLTLTGFGGTGKTRLSLEAATAAGDTFDHVVFVDLSTIKDPELVGSAITQATGVEVPTGSTHVEALRDWVGTSRALIVLDNFEHLLPAATLLTELLAAAPTLQLLVTSQAPLRIRAEREFAVAPLRLPNAGEAQDVGAAGRSPAVGLFVARAQAVKPDFELTAENADAVCAICTRLDGIPLAIELAAARIKLLPPQALLGRLERRLDLLVGGAADVPERQRTLRNAIDWSYDLLEPTEQQVLARIGVFVGGCSLEGAEAVTGAALGLDVGRVFDALAQLVDKGLVRQTESADGEPRFSLLETIREYALDRLEERGEADEVRKLHAARFLQLAESAEPELSGANQAAWLSRLTEENGNIRSALDWSLASGNVELGLRLAGALVRFWSTRGLMAEGRERLDAALASGAEAPKPVLAKAEFAAGYAALGLGEFAAAEAHFERSLEHAAGDVAAEAAARAQLAWIAMTKTVDGEGPARELASQALEAARTVDDKRTASGAVNTLAELALQRGESDEAMLLMEEGLALRRSIGDRRLVANSLLNLARARLSRLELTNAQQLLAEGHRMAVELGDTWCASVALAGIGRVHLLDGAPADAVEPLRESLRLAVARRDKRAIADCLQGLGSALGQAGDPHLGARLLGAAEATLEAIGASPTPVERALEEQVRPALRAELGQDFEYKLAAGRSLPLDEAIALALPDGEATRTSFQTTTA